MGTVTAKQLKQRTGEIIKRLKSGERFTLTHRGKPVAVIDPSLSEKERISPDLRSFDEAWEDIERELEKTKPRFDSWKEATRWARNRV
ncbi:MAG: type II toxin-antitoxin system prevent-host-death family antitoxin [Syntrophobacterales bacterium]|jgi:prevent-host-death family protein